MARSRWLSCRRGSVIAAPWAVVWPRVRLGWRIHILPPGSRLGSVWLGWRWVGRHLVDGAAVGEHGHVRVLGSVQLGHEGRGRVAAAMMLPLMRHIVTHGGHPVVVVVVVVSVVWSCVNGRSREEGGEFRSVVRKQSSTLSGLRLMDHQTSAVACVRQCEAGTDDIRNLARTGEGGAGPAAHATQTETPVHVVVMVWIIWVLVDAIESGVADGGAGDAPTNPQILSCLPLSGQACQGSNVLPKLLFDPCSFMVKNPSLDGFSS